MTEEKFKLIKPAVELEASHRSYVQELRTAGEPMVPWVLNLSADDFPAFVARLNDMSSGVGTASIGVANSTYWMVDRNSEIVGISNFRYELTAILAHQDGHIGYSIRPCRRSRGYATTLLAMTLGKAGAFGLQRVLVTCEADNAASARVIEKNGGRLEDQRISKRTGKPILRYWIDL